MSVVASTTAMQIPGDVLEQRDGNNASARGKLDGWKEIAAYLRRTSRTVQRWERSEGLPVLRHRHARGATVYAYRHKVDQWLQEKRTVVTEGWRSRAEQQIHCGRGTRYNILE